MIGCRIKLRNRDCSWLCSFVPFQLESWGLHRFSDTRAMTRDGTKTKIEIFAGKNPGPRHSPRSVYPHCARVPFRPHSTLFWRENDFFECSLIEFWRWGFFIFFKNGVACHHQTSCALTLFPNSSVTAGLWSIAGQRVKIVTVSAHIQASTHQNIRFCYHSQRSWLRVANRKRSVTIDKFQKDANHE